MRRVIENLLIQGIALLCSTIIGICWYLVVFPIKWFIGYTNAVAEGKTECLEWIESNIGDPEKAAILRYHLDQWVEDSDYLTLRVLPCLHTPQNYYYITGGLGFQPISVKP